VSELNYRLPLDFCRCLSEDCTQKNDCLRYLTRKQTGQRTPFAYLNSEENRNEKGECTEMIQKTK
jgi:hypothetical protein